MPGSTQWATGRKSDVHDRIRERTIACALALLTAVLAFFRLRPSLRSTIWAEDGWLFLGAPLERADLAQLFEPYCGYLHVLPRALGMLIAWTLPVDAFATAVNLAACATVGIIAATVYVCAEDSIASPVLRGWLALMTVLLPLVGAEVVGNLTNLHTFFLWGSFGRCCTVHERRCKR